VTGPRHLAGALGAAAALACAGHTPHGLLRVELDDDDEARLVSAVRYAVSSDDGGRDPRLGQDAMTDREGALPLAGHRLAAASSAEGLACVPSSGAVLLRCSPAGLGSAGHTVTVVVSRVGSGYQIAIDQAWSLAGRTPAVCAVQRHLANAVNAALSPTAARVDARSECKEP
jgi:hypothetical protein